MIIVVKALLFALVSVVFLILGGTATFYCPICCGGASCVNCGAGPCGDQGACLLPNTLTVTFSGTVCSALNASFSCVRGAEPLLPDQWTGYKVGCSGGANPDLRVRFFLCFGGCCGVAPNRICCKAVADYGSKALNSWAFEVDVGNSLDCGSIACNPPNFAFTTVTVIADATSCCPAGGTAGSCLVTL